jgi:hypothetical protein
MVGQVVSGRGMGTHRVIRYKEELHTIVKQYLYPGTLNILLDRPVRLPDDQGFTFDREGGMVWPAFLNGVEVWIYRWRWCPLHVMEVLSPLCLRERLSLKDGDNVRLGLSEEQTGEITPLGRLAWAALWIGRRNSYFLRDTCHSGQNKTMLWSRKLGALQQQPEVKGALELSLLVMKKIFRGPAALGAIVARGLKLW